MDFIEKITKTSIYQVFVVKAPKKSKNKVIIIYVVCLFLFMLIYPLLSGLLVSYKPLEELPVASGTIVKIVSINRGPDRLVMIVNGKAQTFSLYLPNVLLNKFKAELPLKARLAYVKYYQYWPFHYKKVIDLVINGEVIKSYINSREDLVNREFDKKVIVSNCIIIFILLVRVWIKYK
ncbi:MAG: hypothetical protein QNK36_20960 [Colwellia sp.]|nr:hypothetical protein [Colwellia sp.]